MAADLSYQINVPDGPNQDEIARRLATAIQNAGLRGLLIEAVPAAPASQGAKPWRVTADGPNVIDAAKNILDGLKPLGPGRRVVRVVIEGETADWQLKRDADGT